MTIKTKIWCFKMRDTLSKHFILEDLTKYHVPKYTLSISPFNIQISKQRLHHPSTFNNSVYSQELGHWQAGISILKYSNTCWLMSNRKKKGVGDRFLFKLYKETSSYCLTCFSLNLALISFCDTKGKYEEKVNIRVRI